MIESVIKVVKFSLRYLETVWFYARRIGKKLVEEDILFLASGLAFNGILTMIPLMLLTASAIGVVLNSSQAAINQLNDVLNAIFPPQPFATSIKESILTVLSDIIAYRRSIGVFAVIVLLWTGTSLFDALRSVLHRIYHLKRTRGLLLSIVHNLFFVFLVFVLFVVSNIVIWAISLLEKVGETIPAIRALNLSRLDDILPTLIVIFLTAVMFYVVYRYIPDSKPPRLAGIISTLTTTTLWIVSGKIFALYLSNFSAIGKIYGPYAFILVLLIWIYYSSIVFVVGGIVGQAYWERHRLKEAGKLKRWV